MRPNKKWLFVKELNRMTNRTFPAAIDRFVLKKIHVEQNQLENGDSTNRNIHTFTDFCINDKYVVINGIQTNIPKTVD